MSSFSIQHFLIRADVIEGYGVYLPKRLEKWTSVFKNTVKQKQQLMQVIHFSRPLGSPFSTSFNQLCDSDAQLIPSTFRWWVQTRLLDVVNLL